LGLVGVLIAVWFVVYLSMAQGSKISVFFSPLQHIKIGPFGTKQPLQSGIPDKINESRGAPRGPVTLAIQHNVSSYNADEVMVTLRSKRKLRELKFLESCKPIAITPSGTFFFVDGWALEIPSEKANNIFQGSRAYRFKVKNNFFEFHYPYKDSILLIAFVKESDASKVAQLKEHDTSKIMLFPYPWAETTTLVSVPIERISRICPQRIQMTKVDTVFALEAVLVH
jgi:hypothetical protein